MQIIDFQPHHLESVVRLSLRAWEPVFESLRSVLGEEVFQALYPDWRAIQAKAVTDVCAGGEMRVWVALEGEHTAGFAAVRLDAEASLGEVYMIAVAPDFQRRGAASALMRTCLDWIRQAGMSVVMVGTGGDLGHAPARGLYESLGFRPLPLVQYYQKLPADDR